MAKEEKPAKGKAAPAEGGDDEMAAAMGDTGTLSQSEIDNLLGFDGGGGDASTGIQALLDRSLQTYERLPMLEVVFDRYIRSMSTSLRNFTSENVDVNIDSITSLRFEDYLNSVPLPALLAIFQAIEWENFGLITIDSSLTYSMVDVLLGGGRTHRPVRIEGRPFTTIEQDIVRSLARLMLEDMSAAFNPLTPATFQLERLESNPRFATITRPANAVILISLRVEMDDRGGKAEIVIPYATIEPIKDLLLQMFAGESFGADVSWEAHLSNELKNTNIHMEVVLDNKFLTLRELAKLEVGSTITMDIHPDEPVDIKCKGIKMMKGSVGSIGNHVAIKVNKVNSKGMKNLI